MKCFCKSLLLTIVLFVLSYSGFLAQDTHNDIKLFEIEGFGVSVQKPLIANYYDLGNSLTFKTYIDFSLANKFPLRVALSSLRSDAIKISDIYGSQSSIGYFNGVYESITVKSIGLGSYLNIVKSSKFNVLLGLSFSYFNMFIVKDWNKVAVELFDKDEYFPFFQLNYARSNALAYGLNSEISYTIKNNIQFGLDLGYNGALFGNTRELGGLWEIEGNKNIMHWYDHFYYGVALRYLLK